MKGFWALGLLDVAVRLVFGFLEAALRHFSLPPSLIRTANAARHKTMVEFGSFVACPLGTVFPKPLNS